MAPVLEQKVKIDEEGKVTMTELPRAPRSSSLPEIMRAVNDPSTSIVDVSRLIAREIAAALNEQDLAMEDPTLQHKVKVYDNKIKNLRALSQQLTETEVLSRKDMLNFDGPKFQYWFKTMLNVLKKSINKAGCDETETNSILKHFRDEMTEREKEIRMEVEKFDSSSK